MNPKGSRGEGELLRVEKTEDPRGFRLIGEVDLSSAGALAEALEADARQGGDLALELSGLTFMDSTGLHVLLRTVQQMEGRGRLILLSPGERIQRLLELAGLYKVPGVDIRP
jgi:anti-anti-sigma factor